MGSISPAPVFRHVQKAVYFPELNTDIRGFLPFTQTKSAEQSKKSRKIASPQNTADIFRSFLACEQALLFGRAKQASRERELAARVLVRLTLLDQIGELARRLEVSQTE